MAKSAGHTSPAGALASLSTPRLRTAAALIAAVGMFAVLLGLLVGAKPAFELLTVQPPIARSMTFSYGTTVPKTSAYDSTTVTAPDPIFRSVADTVDVTYAYTGTPGQVEVNAELFLPNGWHSTVPLAAATATDGSGATSVVHLKLDALAARAAAGAKASSGTNIAGAPIPTVKIAVVPQVTTDNGKPFAPALNLQLTPLSLALQVPDGSLKVDDVAPATIKVPVPQGLSFAGRDLISVIGARILSAILLSGALLAAAGLMTFIRRAGPVPEDEVIRRQYAALLVEVRPMDAPTDRPVVEVTEFKTLERLAKRYGLLILHWTADGSTTFTVQDDATAYRYHTGPAASHEPALAESTLTDLAASSPIFANRAEPGPVADTDSDIDVIVETGAGEVVAAEEVVAELAHWETELELTGAWDELTSLANLSLFETEVQYAVDNGGDSARLCLMLVDVDDLGSINEEFGQEAGDAVLVGIAERLRRAVRPRDLVARLEGDDFGVLFEDVAASSVDTIATRIMQVVHESMPVGDRLMQVNVSLGIAQAAPVQDASELMQHGRAALVEAKNTHNAHYAWFVGNTHL